MHTLVRSAGILVITNDGRMQAETVFAKVIRAQVAIVFAIHFVKTIAVFATVNCAGVVVVAIHIGEYTFAIHAFIGSAEV